MLKMNVILSGKINGMTFEKYRDSKQYLGFGGYCFKCMINGEDKSVCFDWNSFVANVQEDGTLLLEAGERTWFGGDEELDNIYDEEYKENGFSRSDLTAKVLASTTSIEEFVVDYDIDDEKENYINLHSIIFFDETGSYEVSKDVLDKYNNLIAN